MLLPNGWEMIQGLPVARSRTHLAVLVPEVKPFERLIFPTKYVPSSKLT